MSIHVTVNGNPVNIRRGRMVLSDLDQIKKNERDRRRRLRLEQVRQQSKEISNRLLERAKRIAREELDKLEKDGKSELKQMHDRKIMEIQQKYQEDLEDIGQAHVSAALQPDVDVIIEEEEKKNRVMALKRGKDAMQRMKEAKQKSSIETCSDKLHITREMTNTGNVVTTKLPKQIVSEENSKTETSSSQDTNEEIVHKLLTPKTKNKKISRKSPRKLTKSIIKEHQKILSPKPGPSGLQKQFIVQPQKTPSKKNTHKTKRMIIDNASQSPRRIVPVVSTTPTKAGRIARYNPEDYTQDASSTSSISSSSSSSISDDSSYFSDGAEQITCNKTPKAVSLKSSKIQLYDHETRQKNVYDRPLGMVERIDIRSEPNAVEAAEAVKDAENIKTHIIKNRKLNAQRRGEDAILREKVRRDYQALIDNLDHLAQEERKLKASQIHSNAMEDTHMRLHQRNKYQEERQKKLDRTAVKILSTDGIPTQYSHLTERVITLPTERTDDVHNIVPHSTWQEPHLIEEEINVCYTEQDKDSEISREEQILDMLKKVERQKRLLLQEFGAALPDEIFNASIKPLFGATASAKSKQDTAKPLSPEVKVINMSSCGECVREDRKVKKSGKSPKKKIEIAVQATLDKTVPAEDKSIQVELSEENTDIPRSSSDTTTQRPHPIEPKITIITPETDDSSNDSTSSEITGMVIEIDKKEVTVTPKKKKNGIKISKQPSPRVYQKIRSSVSKATSPMKRFTRSPSNSRLSSSQRKARCFDTPNMTSRKVDIHMSKSRINNDIEPSQETKVSIDASAESSQTFSGVNDQNQSSSKPYRVRTQMKRWIRIKDTSDTSTSFASPPPVKPRSVMDALTNVTPILEMLDSLGPEELRRQDISPVSTPETPSPRTMMMPSNIPHRATISRMLRYNSIDSQTNDNTIFSSTQIDQSTMTEPSDIRQESAISECLTSSRRPSVPPKICTCKNPGCKLLHTKFEDIHDYALKNCPEILQKYEDLQNLCTERIASLTDLIEKVRNEQKDMDFSLISPSDETSLMQIPSSRPTYNDAQAVRNLVESIEAVHAQLAKTLLESQRIIGKDIISEDEISRDIEVQATTSTPRSKSVDTVLPNVHNFEITNDKTKPKIISDEKVNLQLNRFKMQRKPRVTLATKTLERNSWPSCTVPEEEATKEKDFIPILAGIPKVSRTGIPSISTRAKPPVTLLNGLYRPELESSGHELSTIVEFDTPDAASRSPIKSKNINANAMEHLQKGLLKRAIDAEPFKSAIIIKPSVHVAPLPVQQNQNLSKKLVDPSDVKCTVEKLISTQGSQETTTTCSSPGKLTSTTDPITAIKDGIAQEWIDYGFEKCNKELQCNTTIEQLTSQPKDKLGSSISTDFNNLPKDSKHKTTSTSLNSFSGLSGISEITSSPSSDILKYASSPEEMETALKKLGLGWAVTTLKKTREASALSSSSNSDVTPINTARRMISPTKKHYDPSGLLDFSDVSSISIKEQASKSTEQVLSKGRTSTPKLQNTNSNSEISSTTNTSESFQEPSDSLTVPNMSLIKTKSDSKQLQSP